MLLIQHRGAPVAASYQFTPRHVVPCADATGARAEHWKDDDEFEFEDECAVRRAFLNPENFPRPRGVLNNLFINPC